MGLDRPLSDRPNQLRIRLCDPAYRAGQLSVSDSQRAENVRNPPRQGAWPK